MKSKKNNFVEKTINFLLNILIFIFTIILLISIYTGVQTKILGNDYTDFFGYSLFEVQTGSMADTINAGDWIIVKLSQKVKLNDVVTYKLDGEYITHRVIEVYKGTYITKGDANNAKDDPVDQNQIIGKVVSVWANFGIIRKTLFNPSVLIALIVTLFLFNFSIKKNKNEGTNKSTNFNKTINKFLNVVIEKANVLIKVIIKKIGLLYEKIKELIGNKKFKIVVENKKVEKSNNMFYTKNDNKNNNFDNSKESTSKVETEEYYKDTDELDKTTLYRVVPVDANEVDDKFKSVPTMAEVEEYYKDADELDKTSLYRIIPVDASEVNDTLLEIAENEIKETEKNDKNKEKQLSIESKPDEETSNDDNDALTKIDFDLLKNLNGKKGKNIIDTAMLIKKEELYELINVLVKNNNSYVNKPTIKDIFIDTYIDAKYYNYYGDNDIKSGGKKLIVKIEKVIQKAADELINDYHGKDNKHSTIVDIYANTLILIANLDAAKELITDSKAKNEFYKNAIVKYFKDSNSEMVEYLIDEILKIQKKYNDTLNCFLEKLETNMFNLNFNKLSTKEDMYGLALEHNITFSKIYSDYIIDKTYSEGIIAEDKLYVLLTLLSVQLIKDMISFNFDKRYILYIPESLYTKEKKLEHLLGMIEDKYAKDNAIILITFEDLLNNKQIVKEIRKMGYKFALVFDEHSVIKENDRGNIYIADYIFVNKDVANMIKVLPFIPEELSDKVIYEDIVDKIDNLGGE